MMMPTPHQGYQGDVKPRGASRGHSRQPQPARDASLASRGASRGRPRVVGDEHDDHHDLRTSPKQQQLHAAGSAFPLRASPISTNGGNVFSWGDRERPQPLSPSAATSVALGSHRGGGGDFASADPSPDRPTTRSMPRPPTSAVPSQRPSARQRPMMQSLDLWGARGTPAVATRAARARLGTANRAAAGLTLADEAEFSAGLGDVAGAGRNHGGGMADIPIVIDDGGWGGLMPAPERATVILGGGRRPHRGN